MNRFSRLLAVSVFALLPAAAGASTLLVENFDSLTPQFSAYSVGAFSPINGTNVDIVGGAIFANLCSGPESGNCVDLDGSGDYTQAGIRTNTAFALLPGVDYFLSFNLIGSQRGATTSTTVSFASYNTTFVLGSSDTSSGVVSNALVTVGAPTLAKLTFSSNTAGVFGALLDNVRITSSDSTLSPTETPEPASLILLGTGLLALSARRVRKR